VIEAHRGVWLRVVTSSDIQLMWTEETAYGRGSRWRTSSTTPSLADFADIMWRNVLHQYLVMVGSSLEPAGVVVSYDYDALNGHCKVGVCSYRDSGYLALIGVQRLLRHVFSTLPIRKVYFELVGSNESHPMSPSFGKFAQREGVLEVFEYLDGEWIDL
jgi:hypothetical protein